MEFPEEKIDEIINEIQSLTEEFRRKQDDILFQLENDELSFKEAAGQIYKLSSGAGAKIATYTVQAMFYGFELIDVNEQEKLLTKLEEKQIIEIPVEKDIKKLN